MDQTEPLPDLVKRLTGLKAEADHWRAEWGDQADPAYEQQYSQALAEAAPRLLAAAESLVRTRELLAEARGHLANAASYAELWAKDLDDELTRTETRAEAARATDLLARIDAEIAK